MPHGIKCRRCGKCAVTQRGITVSSKEAARIGNSIGLANFQSGAKIPLGKGGHCAAFEKKGAEGSCKIYRQRPAICRQYPVIFFQGRAIIQSDCTAAKELLAHGKNVFSRNEIKKIPFFAKSLKELEQAFPDVKKQNWFEITNA